MDVQEMLENNKLVITLGFSVFSFTNYLTRYIIPESACRTTQQRWKWRNVATSFIHSFITGIWSPLAFYQVTRTGSMFKIRFNTFINENKKNIGFNKTR